MNDDTQYKYRMNNCTVCSKPVDEHLESEATDICVAKKLGWQYRQEAEGFWCCIDDYDIKKTDLGWWLEPNGNEKTGWACANPTCGPVIPHYSSPTMSAECWGLVEKFEYFYLTKDSDKKWSVMESVLGTTYDRIYASTAPLAICRGFLAMVEK